MSACASTSASEWPAQPARRAAISTPPRTSCAPVGERVHVVAEADPQLAHRRLPLARRQHRLDDRQVLRHRDLDVVARALDEHAHAPARALDERRVVGARRSRPPRRAAYASRSASARNTCGVCATHSVGAVERRRRRRRRRPTILSVSNDRVPDDDAVERRVAASSAASPRRSIVGRHERPRAVVDGDDRRRRPAARRGRRRPSPAASPRRRRPRSPCDARASTALARTRRRRSGCATSTTSSTSSHASNARSASTRAPARPATSASCLPPARRSARRCLRRR